MGKHIWVSRWVPCWYIILANLICWMTMHLLNMFAMKTTQFFWSRSSTTSQLQECKKCDGEGCSLAKVTENQIKIYYIVILDISLIDNRWTLPTALNLEYKPYIYIYTYDICAFVSQIPWKSVLTHILSYPSWQTQHRGWLMTRRWNNISFWSVLYMIVFACFCMFLRGGV